MKWSLETRGFNVAIELKRQVYQGLTLGRCYGGRDDDDDDEDYALGINREILLPSKQPSFEDGCVLRSDIASNGISLPMFQRNVLPLTSG